MNLKVIRLDNLVAYEMGPDFVISMIQTYYEEIPRLILAVEEHIDGNRDIFIRNIHTLKSSAALFKITEIDDVLDFWEELPEADFNRDRFVIEFEKSKEIYAEALNEMKFVLDNPKALKLG
ncbi:MAG: Hpt domain-containing protein [Cyclobacteriaceae bacterium]